MLDDHVSALEPLIDEGWICECLYEVRSGKEATVYCCRGGPPSPVPLVAAKVYRSLESRRFKNDALYTDGRLHMIRPGRAKRAVQKRTAFGRAVQYATWLMQEWEVLNVLHGAGAAVPRPIAVAERAMLMPFFGSEDGPAPMLRDVAPSREEAAAIIDEVLENVELMLDLDCVHGDLSPYNILLYDGRPIIIDFPQTIDPRLNSSGRYLLSRDVASICDWGRRCGVDRCEDQITSDLWSRFVLGEIG